MKRELLNIYGAKISKSGNHVNITLVVGEGEQKEYFTTCVRLDNKNKVSAKVKDGYVLVKIPMLEDKKQDEIF